MLLNFTDVEPIWVTNPRTGSRIDVAPFFYAMEHFDGESDSPINLRKSIDRLIVVMGTTVHDPAITSPVTLASINTELFWLREMLTRMNDPVPIPMAA